MPTLTTCVKRQAPLCGKREVEGATGTRSVYNNKTPCFRTQQQQSACHFFFEILDSSAASSVRYLPTLFKTPEEERQTFFLARDEELTSACQSPMKPENARVPVDGCMNSRALFNSENIDPCLETASMGLLGQPAAGLGRARAGKRKSRVNSKVPIRVFSADAANFMAMVHNLTGFQSSTCLFPGSPQNRLLKPLPSRALHPGMQGMLVPEFSAFPSCDKGTSDITADKFANALSHTLLYSDQSTKLGSYNGNPSIQGGETGLANVSSLWQPMEEHITENKSCTGFLNEDDFLCKNVCKQDQWEGL